MLRIAGLVGLLVFGSLGACGKAEDGTPTGNAGTSSEAGSAGDDGQADSGAGGDGGTVNDQAGAGGDSGSSGASGDVGGPCRTVRRVRLDSAFPVLSRFDWGLAVAADLGVVVPQWHLVSNDGAERDASFSSPYSGRIWGQFALGSYASLSPVVLTAWAPSTGGYESPLSSWSLSEPDQPRDVGTIFDRGTLRVSYSSSFDGQRGLFVSSHGSIFGPRAVLLDTTGRRIGEEHVLASDIYDVRALATAKAGAFAIPDADGPGSKHVRVVELAADGSTLHDVVLPSSVFQSIAATNDGVVGVIEESSGVQAYAIEDEARPLFAHPIEVSELGNSATWLDRSSDGTVSLLVNRADESRIVLVDPAGATELLETTLPSRTLIPGPAGELYVHLPLAGRIDIVRCTGPGFSTP